MKADGSSPQGVVAKRNTMAVLWRFYELLRADYVATNVCIPVDYEKIKGVLCRYL